MHKENALDPKENELEIIRPRGCGRLFNYLIDYKLRSGIDEMGVDVRDKLVLDICCGSGIDAEYLAKAGAKVVILDYDLGGVKRTMERAKRFGFKVYPVIADAENLPFIDGQFSLSFVNDGLHHLPQPMKGIDELFRTAGEYVVIMEPAYSPLTRIAVRLGLSVDYEEHDNNYVYRFKKRELKRHTLLNGFKAFKSRRYLLWHPHMPPKWFSVFEGFFAFYGFLAVFKAVNVFLGKRLGNKISFAAYKKDG